LQPSLCVIELHIVSHLEHVMNVCVCSETNLKVRQALTDTSAMGDDIEQLSAFDGQTQLSSS